jgi:hypothetical protein
MPQVTTVDGQFGTHRNTGEQPDRRHVVLCEYRRGGDRQLSARDIGGQGDQPDHHRIPRELEYRVVYVAEQPSLGGVQTEFGADRQQSASELALAGVGNTGTAALWGLNIELWA